MAASRHRRGTARAGGGDPGSWLDTVVHRRSLLEGLGLTAASIAAGGLFWRPSHRPEEPARAPAARRPSSEAAPEATEEVLPPLDPPADEGAATHVDASHEHGSGRLSPEKIEHYDRPFPDDFLLPQEHWETLCSACERLQRAQRVVGHGRFNLLGFDELLSFGRRFSSIGRFTRSELDFLEEIFYADAARYGFLGDKVLSELTAVIPASEVAKISGTGHYLFRGESLETYRQIRDDLGDTVVLTSGVRGIVKQIHLFLDKAARTEGNLSQASRSLAPPGYSYHAAGDFDLGKVGLGLDNFSPVFAETEEFRRLVNLGYVDLRYPRTNPYGVRFEPWHIKMA